MIPITVVPKGDLPSGLPGVAVSCAFCGSQPTKCVPCAQTAGGSYGGHCVDRDKYEAALRAAEAERDVLAEKVAEIEPLPELVARYLSDEPRTKPAGKGVRK